jgi:hypothetical protein
MVHEIAPNLIGAVGDTLGHGLTARVQEKPRNLDATHGEHEDSAACLTFAAVPALKMDRGDAAIRINVNFRGGCLRMELRTALLRQRHVHRGIVFRLDRADWDAARVAAAGGPLAAVDRIAACGVERTWNSVPASARA